MNRSARRKTSNKEGLDDPGSLWHTCISDTEREIRVWVSSRFTSAGSLRALPLAAQKPPAALALSPWYSFAAAEKEKKEDAKLGIKSSQKREPKRDSSYLYQLRARGGYDTKLSPALYSFFFDQRCDSCSQLLGYAYTHCYKLLSRQFSPHLFPRWPFSSWMRLLLGLLQCLRVEREGDRRRRKMSGLRVRENLFRICSRRIYT